ncbi:MAG TPA: hypothetical protein VFZ75_05150 [Actinomycetota bacterium]|nr:hypothetical protein [Actinomycetota bacterium]
MAEVAAHDVQADAGPERNLGVVLFLSYLDEQGGRISFLHALPDATRWTSTSRVPTIGPPRRTSSSSPGEFYGKPSQQAMEGMRATAAKFGVPLIVEPEFNAGFLRLAPA